MVGQNPDGENDWTKQTRLCEEVDNPELLALESVVRDVFDNRTRRAYDVITKVAEYFIQEQGGQPAWCQRGHQMRQDMTDTYLRRALHEATTADALDIHLSTVRNHCYGKQEDYDRVDFYKDLEEVVKRLEAGIY